MGKCSVRSRMPQSGCCLLLAGLREADSRRDPGRTWAELPISMIGGSRIEPEEQHHVSSPSEKESHNFVRRDELEQAGQLAQ